MLPIHFKWKGTDMVYNMGFIKTCLSPAATSNVHTHLYINISNPVDRVRNNDITTCKRESVLFTCRAVLNVCS